MNTRDGWQILRNKDEWMGNYISAESALSAIAADVTNLADHATA